MLPGRLATAALIALVILAYPAHDAAAQRERVAPFSSISLSAHAGRDVASDGLRDFWDPGTAWGISISTPFHFGSEIGAWAVSLPYTSRAPEQPDFPSHLIGIELLFPVIARPVRLQVGATGGDFLNAFPGFHESEFFAGAVVRIAVPVGRHFAVFARASHTRVFTRVPIDHSIATAGASATMAMPRWLRPVFE
jgi:hypothetical protein